MKLLSDYSGLEKLLRQEGSSVVCTQGTKQRVRARLMKMTRSRAVAASFGFAPVVSAIRVAAEPVTPSPSFVASLREKLAIMTHLDAKLLSSWRGSKLLSNRYHRKIPLRNLFAQIIAGTFSRRVTASGILGVFVLLLLGNVLFAPQITFAKYESIIEETNGDVLIERDRTILYPYKGFILQENDIITTFANASASVRFLDQSIGRLAENTAVEIAGQKVNSFNKGETVVELVLNHGRLWTRVVNLISNKSSFEVKAASITAVAKRRAAFDVSVSPEGKSRVTAVHNRVDVRVAHTSKVVETTLVKGFSAEVQTNAPSHPFVLQAPTVSTQPKEIAWLADNLSKDQIYIEKVKEDSKVVIREQAGVLPGDALYGLEQLSDSTSVALSLDPVTKNKKILGIAESKLAEAMVLAENGDGDGAKISLEDFIHNVTIVSEWVHEIEATHPEQVVEVKTSLETLLAQSHKSFMLVLPTDELYLTKQAVTQAEVLVAQDPVTQTEERLNNAAEKLVDAHDLAQQGNTPAATQQIDEYKDEIEQVVGNMRDFDPAKKEKAMEALLDAKKEDIKSLEAIGTHTVTSSSDITATPPTLNSSSDKNILGVDVTIEDRVDQAKNDALVQIGEAVLDIQSQLPSPEVLQRIEEIQKIDVNGENVVRVQVTPGKLLIRTKTTTISLPAIPTTEIGAAIPTDVGTASATTTPIVDTTQTHNAAIDMPAKVLPPGTQGPTMIPKSDQEMPEVDRSSLKIPQ